jgi:menaquinone-specific isochorismate synthase
LKYPQIHIEEVLSDLSGADATDSFQQWALPSELDLRSISKTTVLSELYFSYFEKPSQGLLFCGFGESKQFSLTAEGSISNLHYEVQRVLSEGLVGSLNLRFDPIVLGGFRFDLSQDPDAVWADFGRGRLILPELLFSRRQNPTNADVVESFLTVAPGVKPAAAIRIIKSLYHNAELRTQSEAPLVVESDIDETIWADSINNIVTEAKQGKFSKVVLATRRTVTGSFEVSNILSRLRDVYPECFIFCFPSTNKTGETKLFLGATPELLVSQEEDQIKSLALAGSIARGDDRATDSENALELARSNKDIGEHDAVIKAISERLRPLTSAFHISTTRLRRLSNIQHLSTEIEAESDGEHVLLDLVNTLHPTPAVCGTPRDAAQAMIRRNEQFDRGWYAGPVGWLSASGNGEFAVGLRSAVVGSNVAWLFAGNGIVEKSSVGTELQEVKLKFQPLMRALSGELNE